MSEKDFWTKYCRAEYLQWSRNSATVAAEAAEDEHLAIFLKHDDILVNEARRKVLHTSTSQISRGLSSTIWQKHILPMFWYQGMFLILFLDIFLLFDKIVMGADETCWSNIRHGSWSRGWLHASSRKWHFSCTLVTSAGDNAVLFRFLLGSDCNYFLGTCFLLE